MANRIYYAILVAVFYTGLTEATKKWKRQNELSIDFSPLNCETQKYSGKRYNGTLITFAIRLPSTDICVAACWRNQKPGRACKSVNYIDGNPSRCELLKEALGNENERLPNDTNLIADPNSIYVVPVYCQETSPAPSTLDPQTSTARPTPTYGNGVTNNIQPGSCGQTSVPKRQCIVNGYEAPPHSVPWIISLRNENMWHYGAAVLIRVSDTAEESDIILTAGHCVAGNNSGVNVVAGAHYRTWHKDGEVSVRIAEAVLHPNKNSDFAIVKLTKPIKFSRTIQPLCLPEPNVTLPEGTAGIAAGWGDVGKNQGNANEALQQVVLKTVNTHCNTNLWVCNRQPDQNVCYGDSGGPFFFEGKKGYTLHGIISGGRGCEGTNAKGNHVRVSVYIDWIQDQIKKLTAVQ